MKNNLSLNRITYPNIALEDFLKLAQELGFKGVELRNDINDGKIFDGNSPEEVKSLSEKYDLQIFSINAIQKFNLGTDLERVKKEVKSLINVSLRSGCKSIVLCPNNDINDRRSPDQCYKETVNVLKAIGRIISDSPEPILFLIEPLGFEECSLRSKKDAVKAIEESGFKECFKLVHDTFHHYLGPDDEIYPEYTGLVHISGVETCLPKNQMRDEHRILITEKDILGNIEQIANLKKHGYSGVFSLEPFSEIVQNMNRNKLIEEIRKTAELISSI